MDTSRNESIICFLCDYWWALLGGLLVLAVILLISSSWFSPSAALPAVTPASGGAPAGTPQPMLAGPENPYITPAGQLPAEIGDELTPVSPAENWKEYQNPVIRISLKYPSDWRLIEDEDKTGFGLLPPGSEEVELYPNVLVSYLGRRFDAKKPLLVEYSGSDSFTPPNAVTFNTIGGIEYRDNELSIPGQHHYIELPHRQGMLFASIYIGPGVSLLQQAQEILSTLEVLP